MKNVCLALICGVVTFSLNASDASAHSAFKKAFQTKIKAASVKCDACHVKGQKKDVRNDFGKVFAKLLKDKKLTDLYNTAKKEGTDARKKAEEKMAKEFLAVLDKAKAEKSPAGATWGSLIDSKKLENVTFE